MADQTLDDILQGMPDFLGEPDPEPEPERDVPEMSLPNAPVPVKFLEVPGDLLYELAGVNGDLAVYLEHERGFNPDKAREIAANPSLRITVEAIRRKLLSEGITPQLKCAAAFEVLIPVFVAMAQSNNTPAAVRSDIFKTLAKLGNVEPKENAGAKPGTGARVVINLTPLPAPQERNITSTSEMVREGTVTDDSRPRITIHTTPDV